MDRDEALRLLKGGPEGVAEWNRRREVGEGIPDLSKADLVRADLSGAFLYEADLRGADLRGTDLRNADLVQTNLRRANLVRADLRGTDLHNACTPAGLVGPGPSAAHGPLIAGMAQTQQ